MIDTALGGMKTRFTNRGKNPSLMILASSKRSEKSFLETHMKQKLKSEGENTLIVDEPVWNVRPPSEYSGKRFKIALGNKFLVSEVIPEGSDVNVYINKGYQIVDVPVEYKANFTDDIERALCDYAGISSSDITKYISGPRLLQAKHKEIVNPFVKDIITVGNDPNDTTQYSDFFDLTRIPSKLRYKPLYIHFDMSITGDRTGIGGTFIIGKKPGLSQDVNSKELYFQVAFYVAVQAPKGWQVSFAKNREFVYWLKEQGFNIKGISSDTFQNASLAQDFISKGFKYEVISVDRVNSEHVCEPYFFFKNALYDGRMLLPEDCPLLTTELVGLERNINTGKIDHSDGGRLGSKDAADSICGSLWNASKHADEFNFEYGETLDTIIDTDKLDVNDERNQITVDFEEMLKQTFDTMQQVTHKNVESDKQHFVDFGLGKATSTFNMSYLSDGIII